MNRLVGDGFREPIGTALDCLSPRMRERLAGTEFLCGVDPAYVGFRPVRAYTFSDGRTISYSELAHTVYPHHLLDRPLAERRTTIVLPTWTGYPISWRPLVVLHELGHALDWILGFVTQVVPVTSYANENRNEAFAEAFAEWWWNPRSHESMSLVEKDPAAVALFEALA